MTTNEKREPPLSVGVDIAIEFNRKFGNSTPEARVWLANRITEAVNAARHGVTVKMVDDLIDAARLDGWESDQGRAKDAEEAAAGLATARGAFLELLGLKVDDPPPSP